MNCQNCNKEIPSGADYCNFCGEKIADSVKKENYSHTIWGKIQFLIDTYETLSLGKLTGHWIFKTLIIVVLVIATYFGFYGDAAKMKFTESNIYRIQYNVETEEYYIISEADSFSLGLYIPRIADIIRYTGYNGEEICQTLEFAPEECEVIVKKGEYSTMSLELIDKGKTKQTIRFSCK